MGSLSELQKDIELKCYMWGIWNENKYEQNEIYIIHA